MQTKAKKKDVKTYIPTVPNTVSFAAFVSNHTELEQCGLEYVIITHFN